MRSNMPRTCTAKSPDSRLGSDVWVAAMTAAQRGVKRAVWLLQIREEVSDLVQLLLAEALEGRHDARTGLQRAQDRLARNARPDVREVGGERAVAAVADLVACQAG